MFFLENIAFTPKNSYSSHFINLLKGIGIPTHYKEYTIPNKRMKEQSFHFRGLKFIL
jgi:phosphoribosylaminoimidazole-succinocarboxamide synthase